MIDETINSELEEFNIFSNLDNKNNITIGNYDLFENKNLIFYKDFLNSYNENENQIFNESDIESDIENDIESYKDNNDNNNNDDDELEEYNDILYKLNYNKFIKSKNKFINLQFFYIKNNNIDYVFNNKITLNEPNILYYENLIYNIKLYSILDDEKYICKKIINFNFSIDTNNVDKYVHDKLEYNHISNINIYSQNNFIYFDDTINYFKHLNSLIIFMYIENKKMKSSTNKNKTLKNKK